MVIFQECLIFASAVSNIRFLRPFPFEIPLWFMEYQIPFLENNKILPKMVGPISIFSSIWIFSRKDWVFLKFASYVDSLLKPFWYMEK